MCSACGRFLTSGRHGALNRSPARVFFDLGKKKAKLHLLQGLQAILLDIDRAIRIIRETEQDSEVIPNLMAGFGIDEKQAEFIAEIRLRNINKEYILKRTQETEELEKEIARLEGILSSKTKLRNIIVKELETVIKKYPAPRHSEIVYAEEVKTFDEDDHIEDYPVLIFLTREGYFKKITPASWRMSSEHKLKDGDEVIWETETTNKQEIIFFTDHQQAYKARLYDFDDTKASVLGDYLPQKLGMDEGETPRYAVCPGDYKGSMIVVFENGKAARFSMESFETKTNRRRLTGAYSDKSSGGGVFPSGERGDRNHHVFDLIAGTPCADVPGGYVGCQGDTFDTGRSGGRAARQAYYYARLPAGRRRTERPGALPWTCNPGARRAAERRRSARTADDTVKKDGKEQVSLPSFSYGKLI